MASPSVWPGALVLLVLSGGGQSQEIPAGAQAKTVVMVRTDTAPTIDGRLDEAVWESAAIIADAANFLSPNWEDWHTWVDSTNVDAGTLRTATTSFFRVAVAAGKSLRWPNPTVWTTNTNWGNDGGTHNFLRMLERWTGQTFNYRGSLVSLYYSTYAVGASKYDSSSATTVYRAPTRDFEFDQDFLDVNKLPPGTPRFRDVVNLGMRQILTPD